MIYLDDKMLEWKDNVGNFFSARLPGYADLTVLLNKFNFNQIELKATFGGMNLTTAQRLYIYERVASYDMDIALMLKETAYCMEIVRQSMMEDLESWFSAHILDGKGMAAALILDCDGVTTTLEEQPVWEERGGYMVWKLDGEKELTDAFEFSNVCMIRATTPKFDCYVACPTDKLRVENGRIIIRNLLVDDDAVIPIKYNMYDGLRNYDRLVTAAIRIGIARLVRFEIINLLSEEEYMQLENKIIVCELLIQNVIDMKLLDDDYSVEADILRTESDKLIALVCQIADGRSDELNNIYDRVQYDISIGADWLYDDEKILDGSFD